MWRYNLFVESPNRKEPRMTRCRAVLFASLFLACIGGCDKSRSHSPSSSATAPSGGPGTNLTSSSSPASTTAPASTSDQDAIRDAVQKHLASNSTLNMAAMDMNVAQTSVNGDQAQADVEFRLKQGGTTMQMTYFLNRHAGGWLVTKSQPGGGQFAHPPTDQNHAGTAPGAQSPSMPDVHDFFKNAPVTKPAPSAAARQP